MMALESERNRTLARSEHRREDSIKIDLNALVWEDFYWSYPTQYGHNLRAVVDTGIILLNSSEAVVFLA
jgi:hypothetical protein